MPELLPRSTPLSDDDLLWVAEIPASQLAEVFKDPVTWVRTKNPNEPHYLISPFTICVERLNSGIGQDSENLLIQGIDGTNILTVLSAPRNAVNMLNNFREGDLVGFTDKHIEAVHNLFAPYESLDAFAASFHQQNLQVTTCEGSNGHGRAYAHFEVWKPNPDHDPELQIVEKHHWLGLFHLAASTEPTFFDKVLTTGLQEVKRFEPRQGTLQQRAPVRGEKIKFRPQAGTIPLVYLGGVSSNETACEMLVMELTPEGAIPQQAINKPYASLPPPQ